MNDAGLVCGVERLADLGGDAERFGDGERSPRQPLRERLAVHELEDQAPGVAEALEPVDGADVRVVERRQQPRLALETREPLAIGRELRRQDLDRDVTSEDAIARPIHFAHAAGAEQADDLVLTEARPGSQRHGCIIGACFEDGRAKA